MTDRRDFYSTVIIIIITNFAVSLYVWSLFAPIYTILANTEEIGETALVQNNETIKLQQQGNAQTEVLIENMTSLAYGIVQVMNQSNVIGNNSVSMILESIYDNREILEKLIENENRSYNGYENGNVNPASIVLISLEENGTGNISSFLGGPLLTNETIPLEILNMMNKTNITAYNGR